MIDIHTHILPGVDDGARTLEESINMIKMALNSGVNTLIATPHIDANFIFHHNYEGYLNKRFNELIRMLDMLQIRVELLPGMEVFGSEEIPELLAEGKLVTLNYSKYLLIEFGFSEEVDLIEYLLFQIVKQGYCPIIAHPERYPYVQEFPELFLRFIKLGAVLQMNRGSILGDFGTAARDTAVLLLKNRLASFVASDAHGMRSRTTTLNKVYQIVETFTSKEYADMLFINNPKRVIENQELLVFVPPTCLHVN